MVITSGAKAPVFMARIAGINACSTLWGKNFQGLKPKVFNAANGTTPQPSVALLPQAKRSSRALTFVSMWTLLPQRLKPVLIQAGTAGLKACSTPWGIRNRKSMNACSSLQRTANGSGNKKACSTLVKTQQTCKQVTFAPVGVH
jgi:hypothetical protein